ncbi:hypothetical protein HID58_058735, partial [Brassica napus]
VVGRICLIQGSDLYNKNTYSKIIIGLRLHRSKMVRLTIWDSETANFRELNHISPRKKPNRNHHKYHSMENYHSQPHLDRAFTSTPTLISYNASKRGINCYTKLEAITPHGMINKTSNDTGQLF